MITNTKPVHQTITLTNPNQEDGASMWELVKNSTLDQNSPYKYIMMCEFFSDTCVVAKEDNKVVGFITGFIPPEKKDVIFIWQVGVDESQRGKGIASKMLKELLQRKSCENVRFLEATVTSSNSASQSLFLKLARDKNTECSVSECFPKDIFPEGNHEAELMYRVGPISE